MKDASKALTKEIQRIDSLMAKWGMLLGFEGSRARRRELATILAEEYGEEITDLVFKALMDEGRMQGVKKLHAWALGILENRHERKEYLPELIKAAHGKDSSIRGPGQRAPGDKMVQPGTQEYLQQKANTYGTTLSEETFRARRMWMWSRCWADKWDFEAIADEQKIPVQQCRKEVSDEMQIQWDRLLNDKELAEYAQCSVTVPNGPKPMTIDEARLQITRRFELIPNHWDSVLRFKKGEEIEKLCKKKGYPSPLRRVTLEDWEAMQKANLTKGQKSKGRHPPEPEPKKRHEIIAELDKPKATAEDVGF